MIEVLIAGGALIGLFALFSKGDDDNNDDAPEPVETGTTQGDDTLTGGAGADLFDGFGGNDVINGLDGADVLRGNSGSDFLRGARLTTCCEAIPAPTRWSAALTATP